MATETRKSVTDPVSLEAQERLIEIMNDSSRKARLAGTEWEIHALKPGTQWLIAQEVIKIDKVEEANFGDVVTQMSVNIPSAVKCIALALLNDRARIFANGKNGAFSEEYDATCETILWNTNQSEWLSIIAEIMSMLDIEVFFSTTSALRIIRQKLLERKKTISEAKLSLPEQNSGR